MAFRRPAGSRVILGQLGESGHYWGHSEKIEVRCPKSYVGGGGLSNPRLYPGATLSPEYLSLDQDRGAALRRLLTLRDDQNKDAEAVRVQFEPTTGFCCQTSMRAHFIGNT